MNEKRTKEYVEERYSRIAESREPCCQSCSDVGPLEIGKKIWYTEEELRNVPEAANMGLGCGNQPP